MKRKRVVKMWSLVDARTGNLNDNGWDSTPEMYPTRKAAKMEQDNFHRVIRVTLTYEVPTDAR